MANISEKSINDLLNYNFIIPSYQRGYRWTEQQVTDLLDDIWEFPNKNDKEWYCLQPLVVTKSKTDSNNYEVIDGQQRLTTIYLILKYLNKNNFEIKYQTRKGSKKNLKDINEDINEEEAENNIDFFYMHQAYNTIKEWFDKHKEQDQLKKTLLDKVKVIWYEVDSVKNAIEIFTRINMGKIPLTNAELIKALFLNSSNFNYEDNEKIKIKLKQLEIASEWDTIEYALQNDEMWYFINNSEQEKPNRIEFIFNLMAEKDHNTNDEYATFRFFSDKFKNKKDINENWKEIKQTFQRIEEWFSNRELYHKIGYLIAVSKEIKDLLRESKNKTKTEFKNFLNDEIKSKVKSENNINELEFGNGIVKNILLLHNVQTMLNLKDESNRFPFNRYKTEKWDIEHIHAIATEVKLKEEDLKEWLNNNFVKKESHNNEDLNKQIDNIIEANKINDIEDNTINQIIEYVLGKPDNGIQNLCLLDRGTNRSYKNDSFKLKRKKIIEQEKAGVFIPVCTKNVFMKYYSENVESFDLWNADNKKNYISDIENVLKDYLHNNEQQKG